MQKLDGAEGQEESGKARSINVCEVFNKTQVKCEITFPAPLEAEIPPGMTLYRSPCTESKKAETKHGVECSEKHGAWGLPSSSQAEPQHYQKEKLHCIWFNLGKHLSLVGDSESSCKLKLSSARKSA